MMQAMGRWCSDGGTPGGSLIKSQTKKNVPGKSLMAEADAAVDTGSTAGV